MSDKPYSGWYPHLKPGDSIGWQDHDGAVHVETFKSMGSRGVEVEAGGDAVRRAYEALSAALDEVVDVESGLRQVIDQEQGEPR